MNIICEKCMMDPTSHSFKKISEKNGVITYYTNPTKAKLYNDTTGILEHYNNALNILNYCIDKFKDENISITYFLNKLFLHAEDEENKIKKDRENNKLLGKNITNSYCQIISSILPTIFINSVYCGTIGCNKGN